MDRPPFPLLGYSTGAAPFSAACTFGRSLKRPAFWVYRILFKDKDTVNLTFPLISYSVANVPLDK